MNDLDANDHEEPDDARLRELATRLGARAGARIDVEAVAGAVTRRLRTPDVVPLTTRLYRGSPRWLRLAAALALLAGAGVVSRALIPSGSEPATFVSEELTDLGVDQLTELLGSLDETLRDAAAPADSTLDDLDAEQLERVLQSLEG
jgi:hypothetical protein